MNSRSSAINSENDNEVEVHLNEDIKMASQWYKENHLKANKDKYQAMVLQNNRSTNVKINVANVVKS